MLPGAADDDEASLVTAIVKASDDLTRYRICHFESQSYQPRDLDTSMFQLIYISTLLFG
jgi:hypothetical protein